MSQYAIIVQSVAYDAGSEIPVRLKTYNLNGQASGSGMPLAPGDAAVMVRYSTADRSEKNHPIYLYSWYHSVHTTSITSPDDVLASQKSAIQTYANLWVTGMTVGGDTHRRTGPYGHVATGALFSPTVRH
jgi:hypothetical protein